MLEKFKRKFGPNETGFSGFDEQSSHTEELIDPTKRSRDTKTRIRHRLMGLCVLILVGALLIFFAFEPNTGFLTQKKSEQVASIKNSGAVKRVDVKSVKEEKPKEVKKFDSTKRDEVAQSLARANPVAPGDSAKKPQETIASKVKEVDIKKIISSRPVIESRKEKMGVSVKESAKTVAPNPPPVVRASSKGQYFIQVIALGSESAAKERVQWLKKMGLPAYTEEVKRRDTNLWRVRVGKFATQQEAGTAADILALNAVANGGVMKEKTTER